MQRMKKSYFKILLAALLLFSICLVGCKKSNEKMIAARIENFEETYNNGDLDGFIENFTAKERRQLQATFSIMNSLLGGLIGFGLDLSDLFSLGISMQEGDWLQIEIKEIRFTGAATSIVKTSWRYTQETVSSGTESCEMYFYMRQEDSDWYIKDMVESIPAEWEIATGGEERTE